MMNFNLSGSSAVAASVLAVALWGAPASHAADGNTLRLQGTMQVNAGEGEQALQSHATVVDPRLGEKAATRLGTAQGQQSLADANASYVLIGLLIGTVICAAVAWMIFGMGARLPIKLFFRITGVLLAVLSVVLVGTGIRGLQTAAVISATPVSWFPDVDWLQIYLGLYPVAEALIAQALVAAFFIGGWLLPYLVHQRNPQKS